MERSTDRGADRPGTGRTTASAVGSLGAVAVALVAGVLLGGWLAFETAHWRGFKSFVEGVPVGSALHLGVLLALVALALVVGSR
jgi:MFS family permease